MTKRAKRKTELRGKARMRAEIVEMSESLHKVGAISDEQLQKTTLRMLGKDALPKVERMSQAQKRQPPKSDSSLNAGDFNV